MPIEKGEILHDRYRVEVLLGQGGFGAVYRAWDEKLKGPCALKESFGSTPELEKQFAREASILFNLRHPSLPRVFDYFSLPEQGDYLVMDYVEGDDLQTLMRRRQKVLVEGDAVAWIEQICDALTYLHNQTPPIIHRDIKPANIKITPQGDAVLVDFGASKMYDPSVETTLGARAITSGYSPPEQYGLGRTDARADVYALGTTLYHLLTGIKPPDSLEMLTGNEPAPPPPASLNPWLSGSVDAALTRAMQLERLQRFQSIAEFKGAISANAEDPLVLTTTPTKPVLAPAAAAPSTTVPPAPLSSQAPQPPTPETPSSIFNLKSSGLIKFLPWLAGIIILALALALLWPDDGPAPMEATQTALVVQQTQTTLADGSLQMDTVIPTRTPTTQPDSAAPPPEDTHTPESEAEGVTETPTWTQLPTETGTTAVTETAPPTATETPIPTLTWTLPPSLTPSLTPTVQTRPVSETGDEACHLIPGMEVSPNAEASLRSRPGILGSSLLSLDLDIPLTVVEGPVWDRIRLDLNTYGWWWHVQGPTAVLDGWLWEDHIEECLP